MNKQPHVVILGGGFGGLEAAKLLKHAPVKITLIDRSNYHLFQPLLYQVATAGLSPSDIASPIRSILASQSNTTVLLAEATSIDLQQRLVVLNDGEIKYDYLVVATGVQNSYFGHEEWSHYAPGLKTLDDALEIRRRVLYAFELAERASNDDERRALLTFVTIGGGPTGVEMAGSLRELARYALAKDFRNIDPTSTRVVLIEAGPRILSSFSEELSAKALLQLEELGVEIILNAHVSNIDSHGVTCVQKKENQDESILITTPNVIWGAGVQATELTKTLHVPLHRQGRVIVNPDLSIPDYSEAFVIGDAAAFLDEAGHILPGVSPVAMQQGRAVAKAIVRSIQGQPRATFHYVDKGTMATIGRSRAVAQSGKVQLSGLIAWLAWLFVHIWYLIGFRNRFVVLLNWAWAYFIFKRGSRILTGARPNIQKSTLVKNDKSDS